MFSRHRPRFAWSLGVVLTAGVIGGCSGGSGSGVMMPAGNSGGAAGNTVVRIFVPTTQQNAFARTPLPPPASVGAAAPVVGGVVPPPVGASSAGTPASPPPPGSQVLAINVNGPTAISQTLAVGPNAGGCAPATGGTSCQLALSLPSGTYMGTIGVANNAAPTAIAFTVTPNGQNVFGVTLSGVATEVAIVPASSLSAQNAQGGIDLYGSGRHPLLVEAFDANQNVIVSNAPATFTLNQSGGALSVGVTQPSTTAPNLFYVTSNGVGNTSSALLRATASYLGPANPCSQANAVCGGTVRVDVRQILAVANSNANDVTLYVNGQSLPLATVQNGVTNPQALIFDSAGDLFVADQPGSVTEYAPPYNAAPTTISNGVNHPQALAIDSRGDLFVANGSGSNTVTMYSPPYTGQPAETISSGIDDPVGVTLDSSSNLFVVNEAANTVTQYAPPYVAAQTTISKGLNAPNSLALDLRGNLFVANLNSTPNSVVEYSPPFAGGSAPIATITNGVNEQGAIGLNGSANLFVPNQGANTVTEYVAPYANPPATIVGGQSQPVALAIDALGNLFVANYGNNTVTVYPPPYASGSWTTLGNGISLPLALALSPATNAATALIP